MKHYKRKSGTSRCTMKVDLKKVYDFVSWEFMEQLLRRLEFSDKFVKWIMLCITTPLSL